MNLPRCIVSLSLIVTVIAASCPAPVTQPVIVRPARSSYASLPIRSPAERSGHREHGLSLRHSGAARAAGLRGARLHAWLEKKVTALRLAPPDGRTAPRSFVSQSEALRPSHDAVRSVS